MSKSRSSSAFVIKNFLKQPTAEVLEQEMNGHRYGDTSGDAVAKTVALVLIEEIILMITLVVKVAVAVAVKDVLNSRAARRT